MTRPLASENIASILICVWLILVAWWNVRDGSPYRMLLRNDPQSFLFKFAHQYDDIDNTAQRLVPQSGNLAVSFRGYDATNPSDQQKAARIYFRSIYRAYPCRVFPLISPDMNANGASLLSAPLLPDEAWLREHDVRAVALFSKLPDGEESVQRFETPQPPAEAPR